MSENDAETAKLMKEIGLPVRVKRIHQIIPAENWEMGTKYSDGKEAISKVVCWALCESEDGKSFVTGMFSGPKGDPRLFLCSDLTCGPDGHFKEYVPKLD